MDIMEEIGGNRMKSEDGDTVDREKLIEQEKSYGKPFKPAPPPIQYPPTPRQWEPEMTRSLSILMLGIGIGLLVSGLWED